MNVSTRPETDFEIVSLETLSGNAPIVVLAPHPDDESLGCGALLGAAFAGHGAHVVCLTDGARSHPGSSHWSADQLARLRAEELVDAVGELGGERSDVTWMGYPDAALPTTGAAAQRIVGQIAALCERLGARSLFATCALDPHADHKACATLARAAVAEYPALRLFDYPIWSREDDPDALFMQSDWRYHRLPTGDQRDAKRRAIDAHRSQHGWVVDDDPWGFVLPPAMVERFVLGDEFYIETPR